MEAFTGQGNRFWRQLTSQPQFYSLMRGGGCFLAGFCLSAASLHQQFLPLSVGLICGLTGVSSLIAAVGSILGYLVFWDALQPVAWCAAALLLSAVLGDKRICHTAPLLMPMAAAFSVAVLGVVFQLAGKEAPPIVIYLLRILLAGVTGGLFGSVIRQRNPLYDWFACGFGVLALAQILPAPYLGLGYLAAGAILVRGAFPAAALAGLALDLAGITPLPMTAILCFSYLIRFLPKQPLWLGGVTVVCVSGVVMYLCGVWDIAPLPGLFLGAMGGVYLPRQAPLSHRRGAIGLAQVRLELAAGVMAQTRQILAEIPETPVDEDLLVQKAAETACNGCSCRKNCKDHRRVAQLPGALLHKPLHSSEELPIVCKKSGRFLAQLHHSQEQLRSIMADRERQRDYRAAVLQQYGFLSGYLQQLSDTLTQKADSIRDYYRAEVKVYCNRPAPGSGDRCLRFLGTGGKYYVVLCDGMGTGPEAAMEAKTGGELLRKLLLAGYPAEHALGSLNSICALRDRAGILTVDLVEIHLGTGVASLYKWGAAPSYLVSDGRCDKLGTATPPPGLAASGWQPPAKRVSLRNGERLIMVSDGVGEESALRICREKVSAPDELMARCLLDCGTYQGDDDATVVCLRLREG